MILTSLSLINHNKQLLPLQTKYTKLSHLIDSKLTNDLDNINTEFIQNIINDYDTITESQEYVFPSHIRIKIKRQYENKNIALPSSLVIDMVECKSNCCVKV